MVDWWSFRVGENDIHAEVTVVSPSEMATKSVMMISQAGPFATIQYFSLSN